MLDPIQSALSPFVHSDDVATVLHIAVSTGQNAILFGPPGHGKSEMTLAALQAVFPNDVFVQSFGEGMTESRLYGGPDLKALEDERVLRYATDFSFLNSSAAIFEEIFDAPAFVLLALKDTLTSKTLRNGAQQVPMKTNVIVALTNKEPQEINTSDTYKALLERFPLQHRVVWKTYSPDDYAELLLRAYPKIHGGTPSAAEEQGVRTLASVCATLTTTQGTPVSPRGALAALRVCEYSRKLHQRPAISWEDLEQLRFLPDFQSSVDDLREEAEKTAAIAKARTSLDAIRVQLIAADTSAKELDRPVPLLQLCKSLKALLASLDTVAVPDSLISDRDGLRGGIRTTLDLARSRAEEVTRG